jgi:hypothetical protein
MASCWCQQNYPQICVLKCLGFRGIVILYDMDLLEDTYLSRGHGSEAVHGFESCICTPYINTAGAGMMVNCFPPKVTATMYH